MKVLANDGISQSGINELQKAGIEISTTTVAQEQLLKYINDNETDLLNIRDEMLKNVNTTLYLFTLK